jgi:tetratricopeptide (TPR) repeat protein
MNSFQGRQRFELPVRLEAIIFVALAAVALILRVNQLSADPPADLSTSQAIYTDPAQYISYARNYVLWGSFNPLHDYRLVFFLKSMTTLMASILFKIAGVGYLQANLVGLAFSFPTIILLYFLVRKAAGNVAAVFYLVFILVDYNQTFYGRMPFLENSMIFFAVLSITILIYARRKYAVFLSGAFLATGIFFGKVIGVAFLFPVTCYALYEYYYDLRPNFKKFVMRYSAFIIGFAAVSIFWFFYSYRPLAESVTGYVREQALNLYGAPEAFLSLDNFIYKYVSFGTDTELFLRMPIPSLLACAAVLVFLFRAGFLKAWKNKLYGIAPGIVYLIAMLPAFYGSLMIWNYRPLRYQTVLIYPICALAGFFISLLIQNTRSPLDRGKIRLFPLFVFAIALVPVYNLMSQVYELFGEAFYYIRVREVLYVTTGLAVILIFGLMKLAWQRLFSPPAWVKKAFIPFALVTVLVPDCVMYERWASAATYQTVRNSEDLATILSPEAVVSGPYAADFTQNNGIRNLIHMFGVATVDTAFFRRYPITHLLLDKSNEEYARSNYPDIMSNSVLVYRYYLGSRWVSLYRVAGATGNISANNYSLSDFEMAQHFYTRGDIVTGNQYMKSQMERFPNNLSANHFSGVFAFDNGLYDQAETYLIKAVEFSPTDFNLRFKLGEFYIKRYKMTENADDKTKALAEFALAAKYNPKSAGKLMADVDALMKEEAKPGIE